MVDFVADISIGDVVLDPFCGAATLLIESVHQQPDALYVGIDDKSVQLERAQLNVEYYSDFIHCSTRTTDHTRVTTDMRGRLVQLLIGDATSRLFVLCETEQFFVSYHCKTDVD